MKLLVFKENKEKSEISKKDQIKEALSSYVSAEAKQQLLISKMDEELRKVKEKYQTELAILSEVKSNAFETVHLYATENRIDLFTTKKSVETDRAVFGFKKSPPAVSNLEGFTWESVTKLLKEFLPAYIRTVEEPNKSKLLADKEKPELLEALPKVGISITQKESFYITIKKTNFDF